MCPRPCQHTAQRAWWRTRLRRRRTARSCHTAPRCLQQGGSRQQLGHGGGPRAVHGCLLRHASTQSAVHAHHQVQLMLLLSSCLSSI